MENEDNLDIDIEELITKPDLLEEINMEIEDSNSMREKETDSSFLKSMTGEVNAHRVLGPNGRSLRLTGHVGFDSLPDQLVNKSVNSGFAFNILCIGETGIGKSTLMDSLFKRTFDGIPHEHSMPKVEIQHVTYDLKESNVTLKLTIVETVGFGDQINKEDSTNAILQYIDANYEAYLQEEMKIKRSLSTYHDTRVHACLYFIAPTGHSLKSLDLVCMKKLDKKVNIIPIIAKADTVSKNELATFKEQIMAELENNGVEIYKFPTDDETVSEINNQMNELLPFAVVGSRDEVIINGEKFRARQYPWGTVLVENENHCDFVKLREMLLRTNMQDLIEKTHQRHYELYRKEKMEQKGFKDGEDSIQETYQNKREQYLLNLQKKEETIRQTFVQKVKDKENELKKAEQELQAKFEEMKKKQSEEKKNVESIRKALDDDQAAFDKMKQDLALHQTEAAKLKKPKK
ncbi:septin-10 isoform X1 [Hydra vulgaris]|uniref:septin-10 isoform X1 n=2 Tax=Hydra vulgaris TaxID=6087 RepID=UPI001F5F642E|nr:septin-6 isoform X1 [Hydra vulgaris]